MSREDLEKIKLIGEVVRNGSYDVEMLLSMVPKELETMVLAMVQIQVANESEQKKNAIENEWRECKTK